LRVNEIKLKAKSQMNCWLKFYLCGKDQNGEDNLLSEEIDTSICARSLFADATSEGTLTGRNRRKIMQNSRGKDSPNVETLVNKGSYLQAMEPSKEGFQRDRAGSILQRQDESSDVMNSAVYSDDKFFVDLNQFPPRLLASRSSKKAQASEVPPVSSDGSRSQEVNRMNYNRIVVSYAYNGNVAGAEVPSSPEHSVGESAHLTEMENIVESLLTYAQGAVVTSEEVPLSESVDQSEELLQMEKMVAMYESEKVPGSPRIGESDGIQQMKRIVVSYAQTAIFHENQERSTMTEEDLTASESMREESFQMDNNIVFNSSGDTQPKFVLSEIAISRQFTNDPAVCFGVSQDVVPKSGEFAHMEQIRLAPAAEERGLSIESMRSINMSIGAYSDISLNQEAEIPGNQKLPEPGETSPPKLDPKQRTFMIGTLVIRDKRDFEKKMTTLFRKYDAGSTFINRNQLRTLYTTDIGLELKDDEWTSLFKKNDRNGDGQISLKEFIKASRTYVRGDNLEQSEEGFLKTQFALFAKKGKIRVKEGIRWITKATGKSSWTSKEYFDTRAEKYGTKGTFAESQFLTYYGVQKFATPTRFDNELKNMGYAKWSKKQRRNKKAMKNPLVMKNVKCYEKLLENNSSSSFPLSSPLQYLM